MGRTFSKSMPAHRPSPMDRTGLTILGLGWMDYFSTGLDGHFYFCPPGWACVSWITFRMGLDFFGVTNFAKTMKTATFYLNFG